MADEDYGSLFLHGVGVGGTLAGNRLNYNLRLQELRSAEALRQMEEKQIAQHLSMQLAEYNRQVQYRADMDKAGASYIAQLQTPPVIPVPMPGPGNVPTMVPVPNPHWKQPEDAAMDTFGRVIAANDPKEFVNFTRDMAYSKSQRALEQQREATTKWMGQRPDLEREKIDAQNQRNMDRIQSRMDELDQKHQNALEILDLTQTHQVHLQEMRNQARLAISQGEVSREQWLNRHLNTTMSMISRTKAGSKMKIDEVKSQALQLLGDAWDSEIGSRRGAAPSTPSKVRRFDPTTGRLSPAQ